MIYRDQLEAVYKLIEAPKRWTQECLARTKFDEGVVPISGEACKWCAIGAFMKLGIAEDWEIPTRLLMPEFDTDASIRYGSGGGMAEFNDTHTHAEVLALLRKAIDRAPVRGES